MPAMNVNDRPRLVATLVVVDACSTDVDDDACFDASPTLKHQKRNVPVNNDDHLDDECPLSPAPSLASDCSSAMENHHHHHSSAPRDPKRRKTVRRVSFAADSDSTINSSNSNSHQKSMTSWKFYDKYDETTAGDIWWCRSDLQEIMKRESKLVLHLKLNTSKDTPSVCTTLKQSINEAFKKCVTKPVEIGGTTNDLIVEVNDDALSSVATNGDKKNRQEEDDVTATATTRGLERYIAPIMGAHRQMVVKSILSTQEQLVHYDPNVRCQTLSARYEHMSKVATNFAIVMAQCDAQIAANL